MSAFVVDTNVPVVANKSCPQADIACVLSCTTKLEDIYRSSTIVIDDGLLILKEYMDNLSMAGQPGAGDYFMKWVWSVQADPTLCERVAIGVDGDSFLEIPVDPELTMFDRSDRKFLAVALGSALNPVIVNAVDSDWAEFHEALTRHGVTVDYLCPQHVSP